MTIKKCAPRWQLREADAPLTVSQWVSKLQSCLQSKLYTLSVLVGPHTVLRVWTAYTMLIEHLGSEMSLRVQSFLHCIAGLFKTPSGPAHAPVLLASLNSLTEFRVRQPCHAAESRWAGGVMYHWMFPIFWLLWKVLQVCESKTQLVVMGAWNCKHTHTHTWTCWREKWRWNISPEIGHVGMSHFCFLGSAGCSCV